MLIVANLPLLCQARPRGDLTVVDFASGMDRIPVTSSSIASAGYSAQESTLEIEYYNGSIYQYFAVPESVFKSLLGAESKGAFVSQRIRGHYPYRRIDG